MSRIRASPQQRISLLAAYSDLASAEQEADRLNAAGRPGTEYFVEFVAKTFLA